MSQYGIFQALYMSFYSKKFYQDVAANWGGKAVLYLLFLLALSWVAMTITMQQGINVGMSTYTQKFSGQIPVMTIKNGVLSTPENRPYTITDPDNHQVVAIIDTSGKYSDIDKTNVSVLVNKTEVISKPKANEVRINKFPESLSMVIDPVKVDAFLLKFVSFAWVLIFPALLIFTFLYRLVQALVYSIIGIIFNAIFGAKLSYGKVLQITLVALTPAIILATIFDFFNIQFGFQMMFYFLLSIGYLLYGIHANVKNDLEPKA